MPPTSRSTSAPRRRGCSSVCGSSSRHRSIAYYEGDGTWGRFGDYEITVEHTPGHCPGNVCLAAYRTGPPRVLEGLFVGDTLFAGSIGRTDLPGGDYETLLRAITTTLFKYPDEAVVYSGHGPDTTIGRERATNPFVLEWMAHHR